MVTRAAITPGLLRWARERRGQTVEAAAQHVQVRPELFTEWEQGSERPTFRQAQVVARGLHVPLGYLFLSEPPTEELPIPDLRRRDLESLTTPSLDLLAVVNDALLKQQWYRSYLLGEGATPLSFVARFALDDPPGVVASAICEAVGINAQLRAQAHGVTHFLRLLVRQVESTGVLVLRRGIVGSNTHRILNPDEFQGFAITDDIAPLIFINGRDYETAKVFTVLHELAHIWVGRSGISNFRADRPPLGHALIVERFCNRIAADALVPARDFEVRWSPHKSLDVNLHDLADAYHVSPMVVLRQARDLDQISAADYRSAYARLSSRGSGSPRPSGGGDFYASVIAYNSRTLTAALVTAVAEGHTLYTDAADLLSVKVSQLEALRERL